MATGKQAFSGTSSAAIFHAILGQAPASPVSLNPRLPSELERIITKALEKDREVRYQVASEMRADLKRLKRETDSGRAVSPAGVAAVSTEVAPTVPRPRRVWLAVLAGAAVLVAVVLTLLLRAPLPPPKVLRIVQLTSDGRSKPSPGLATDGLRLYFQELTAGRFSIAAVSVKGGGVVPIPTPFTEVVVQSGSPDGSELLVIDGGLGQDRPMWVLPLVAGSPRRLGDAVGHAGSWSPDGRQIVFVNGHDLYLINSDGTGSRKLVSAKADGSTIVWWPTWSPDGKRLRFNLWDINGPKGLWEVSADGAGLHPLLPGWNEECTGNWTPDGKYFLFASLRRLPSLTSVEASSMGSFNLWAIRENAGLFQKANRQPVPLTTGLLDVFGPVPSRDGRKIFAHGFQSRGELVRYDARSQQLVPYLGGMSLELPGFSKDGQWVAYTRYPQWDLWRSKVDGSQQLQLTSSPLDAFASSWSPDGKRIAFSGRPPGTEGWHIYVVPADGGASPQQLAPAARDTFAVTWSPDGNALMFDGNSAIHILDLRTQQVSTVAGSEGLFQPRWSPDGRYIAAVPLPAADANGKTPRLVLFDFTTQKWVDLTKMNDVGFPNWSGDGKYVYFEDLGSDPGIFRLRISDRKLERVVSLKEIRLAGRYGSGLSLAPDDSPLILRDTGVEEIYALDWEAP
jgi:Tol biopolymer transport system component